MRVRRRWQPNPDTNPNPNPNPNPTQVLATFLSYTPLSRLALVPSSATSNEKQYACPDVRREVERDAYAYKGNLRVCSVAALLSLGARCEASLAALRCPFFCLTASREQVLGLVRA